ncbi:mechanosensitive ion channel family protein [Aureimonas sp. AU4]|uniref:mechanosensitive ion channel family protein n=1 Tax=Aureimonas sp. AU4 TaxID=1638163 RepID=UPI0007813859|nr:mechanosensitive ion channel family protein [Aureimonas sp. AU4]
MLALAADALPQATLAPVGASIAVLAATAAARGLAARRAARRGEGVLTGAARRRLRRLKGLLALGAILALALLWRGEIGAAALQLAAFTMAIVMAFKELVLCATGSLLRAGGAMYRIGDVVEIDGMLGEVTDGTWLTTHVAELRVDAFGRRATGRSRVLPNSRLFAADIRVERTAGDFVFHAFSITAGAETDVAHALETLEASVERATAALAGRAAETGAGAGRRLHRRLDAAPGRVALATTEIGLPRFDVVLFCPASEIHALERRIRLDLVEETTRLPARPLFAEGLRLVAG